MKKFRFLTSALIAGALLFSACDKTITDPADPNYKGPDQEQPQPQNPSKEYTVDQYGYATFQHQGFTFKIKQTVVNREAAKKAIERMKADLDNIVSFCPEAALKVMKKRAIWMEENNTANSSAAWYHRFADYPASIGDLSAKGKCLEITNYNYYVSWTAQNQPYMVFHELSHLYHDQGLGGSTNVTINNAYKNAKNSGIYKKNYYRFNVKDPQSKWIQTDTPAHPNQSYCLNDEWEYFAEMSEAYWGENDYYPFNYEQLKKHDPTAFAAMEKIWGPRPDKQ